MKLQFGDELFRSYKRLPYKIWYALAEFIDNSTQSYTINREIITKQDPNNNGELIIDIIAHQPGNANDYLSIKDNSIGMDLKDLESALTIGKPPKDATGRSKYGLGMKTAAFWLGDSWEIKTKKLGNQFEYSIKIDIKKTHQELDVIEKKVETSLHYTEITIKQLHHKITPKLKVKIIEYLQNFYRHDFKSLNLKLTYNGEVLNFDMEDYMEKLLFDNSNNRRFFKEFSFYVGENVVHGWAGVLNKGGRALAGFSILQSNRVIKGQPDAYKPESIFGGQIGGANNLVSQRLVGEIHLDGFSVSHTKDSIIFHDDQELELENALIEEIGHLINKAEEYRKSEDFTESPILKRDYQIAVNNIQNELQSKEFVYKFEHSEILEPEEIEVMNNMVFDNIKMDVPPEITVRIGSLEVKVYFAEKSVYEPYLISKSRASISEVDIVINKQHPFWLHELKTIDDIQNFIRQCVYDGVSEWKAWFKKNTIEPETIKFIKDELLRVPYEIKHSIDRQN